MSILTSSPMKILGIVVAIAAAYIAFYTFQGDLSQNHLKKVPEFTAAGNAFGALNDQQACLDETFLQAQGCTNFSCGVFYGKFLKACLTRSEINMQMCNGVPDFTEKKNRPTKDWIRDVCFDRPEANNCDLFMRQVQWQCSQQN